MSRSRAVSLGAASVVLLFVGCTVARSGPTSLVGSNGARSAHPSSVRVGGASYNQLCQPVAETLVDIPLSSARERPNVRAIAGVWYAQAVAVYVNQPNRCGIYTLAVAPGLTSTTLDEIEHEVRQGVATFGVEASPIPKTPHNGMGG